MKKMKKNEKMMKKKRFEFDYKSFERCLYVFEYCFKNLAAELFE